MKSIIIIFFGLGIFLPFSSACAQRDDTTPQSVFVRLYIDSAQGTIQQDMQQELLGPSIRLDTSVCKMSSEQTGRYSARTRSKDNSVILENHPLGDLQLIIFKDSVDPKTGTMTGGAEIQPNGIMDICIPFSEQVTFIEIFDQTTGKIVTSMNISGLTGKDDPIIAQKSVGAVQTENTDNEADLNKENSLIVWIFSSLVGLIASVIIWKFFKKKSSTTDDVSSEET